MGQSSPWTMIAQGARSGGLAASALSWQVMAASAPPPAPRLLSIILHTAVLGLFLAWI